MSSDSPAVIIYNEDGYKIGTVQDGSIYRLQVQAALTPDTSVVVQGVITDGLMQIDGDLTFSVNSFYFDMSGSKGYYPGSIHNAAPDNSTNYVYFDGYYNLVIDSVGYPVKGIPHIRLGRVISLGGFIIRIVPERALFTDTSEINGMVQQTRQIIAGDGLQGGGDLSVDRTISVVANADGSIIVNADDIQVGTLATDGQHGALGGGDLHAAATQMSAGFLSAADKIKLDNTSSGLIDGVYFYAPSATDPILPMPQDGYEYFNTVLQEAMRYDAFRSKWLSISNLVFNAGRDGYTAANSFYRGVSSTTFGTNIGFPVPKGTIVGLAWSRTNSAPAFLEVLINGSVIITLYSDTSGPVYNWLANADFNEGLLQFRNQLGGNATSYVQITAIVKRRI